MSFLTDTILMVEPSNFGFNVDTAISNSFQLKPEGFSDVQLADQALQEFQSFVKQLEDHGVKVLMFKDKPNSQSPDSIFPNNWFSTHPSGELISYPMAIANRRLERREDILQHLISVYSYQHLALHYYEEQTPPLFLEGTGSMVLDRENKTAYASLSPRTHILLLEEFCDKLAYSLVSFQSFGPADEAIYHTNVMMCIGDHFALVGLDTIHKKDRNRLIKSLENNNKEVIELSNDQVYQSFAGNMIQLRNMANEKVLVLSKAAFDSLNAHQLERINHYNDHIITAPIPTIEACGGGSVRCMIAEIFKPY